MDESLKAEIREIIEMIKTVPEPLQLRTMELLLQDALERHSGKSRTRHRDDEKPESEESEEPAEAEGRKLPSEGLKPSTLPMRVKAFMKKNDVTGPQLEKLFHIEGKLYEPMWSLNTTKFSRAQVQISLLHSLQRALTSGEFSFDREEVRNDCKKKNCYESTNFKANFQNSRKYYSSLEKEGVVSLTDDGMTALAELITELSGTNDAK